MLTDKDKEALAALEQGDADRFLGQMSEHTEQFVPSRTIARLAEQAVAEHTARGEAAVTALIDVANPARYLDVTKPLAEQDPTPLFEALQKALQTSYDLGALSMAMIVLEKLKEIMGQEG